MGKYKAGDEVMVDGRLMTIGSWPDDDQGPFFARYYLASGAEVQGVYWAGQVQEEGEPVYEAASISMVQPSDGPVQSTAGELPIEHEAAAAVAADAEHEAAEAAAAAEPETAEPEATA